MTSRPSIGKGLQYIPLKALNTYSSRWKIKARVLEKGSVSTFQRQTGPGSVFTATFVDAEGTQMNCKFWNSAADKFYPLLEQGKIYVVSKGRIGAANKRYSNGVDHSYEMIIDHVEAEIQPVADTLEDSECIPLQRNVVYSSIRAIALSTKKLPFTISMMGVPHTWQPAREVNTKAGDTTTVRNVALVDATKYLLNVAFWGAAADLVTDEVLNERQVIAIQGLQIREGNREDRVGSTSRASAVTIDPDLSDAHELKDWYVQHGSIETFSSLGGGSNAADGSYIGAKAPIEATLASMEERIRSGFDDSIVFSVSAFVSDVIYRNARQDNAITFVYSACSKCNKKVGPDSQCPSCTEKTSTTPRLALTLALSDYTAGGTLVRLFHAVAQTMFKVPAKKLEELVQQNRVEELNDICIYNILWKRFTFAIRAKHDLYNSEVRVNLTIGSAVPTSPSAIGAAAMQSILRMVPTAFDSNHGVKRVCLQSHQVDEEDDNSENKKPKISSYQSPKAVAAQEGGNLINCEQNAQSAS